MIITKQLLYKGCLIASLSHAIMTNVYPELSYEQSWDGKNYSIQDSQGLRGTITFDSDYCVAAIRNEDSSFAGNSKLVEKLLLDFPLNVVDIARAETLQYMLIDDAGIVMPSVTSMFWADDTSFHYSENNEQSLKLDLNLISSILLSEEDAINAWQEYYDMNDDAIVLVKYLLSKKESSLLGQIVLDDEMINLIPGDQLSSECIESLSELNIIIPQGYLC